MSVSVSSFAGIDANEVGRPCVCWIQKKEPVTSVHAIPCYPALHISEVMKPSKLLHGLVLYQDPGGASEVQVLDLNDLEPPPVAVKYSQLLIDGKFVNAVSGRQFSSIDPRSGDVIARVAEANKADVDLAVKAARRAFDSGPWPRMSGADRARTLHKFADLLEKHSGELAILEALDAGKPIDNTMFLEMPTVIKFVRYYAGWADKLDGKTLNVDGPYFAYTHHEPIGVVGQILSWNFPLTIFVTKVCPALICGCTIVLKPAEQTPLTALFAAKLALDAGLPPGVLNVVPGYGTIAGAAVASHMGIDKVSFTGSTEVGRAVLRAAADSNLKPVTLELGGKSPLIICNDADLDMAVELAHFALFFNQGQVYFAGSRTFVQEGVYDEFLRRSKKRALQRVVGDPLKSGVEQGPQVDEAHFDTVMSYIYQGKRDGAKLLTGGSQFGSKGYFIEPTIFADVEDWMSIAKEEIFGPVMSVLKFRTIDEVIRRANNTRYGLAAGIFTKDLETAMTLSRAIKAGIIWVNCYDIVDCNVPFGGYKQSGLGREHGLYGIQQYLQVKAVVVPLEKPTWL